MKKKKLKFKQLVKDVLMIPLFILMGVACLVGMAISARNYNETCTNEVNNVCNN